MRQYLKHLGRARRIVLTTFYVLMIANVLGAGAAAAWQSDHRITRELALELVPTGAEIGDLSGSPQAVPVFKDGILEGYAFLTREILASTGFSGKPVELAIGMDAEGVLTGVRIIEHHEPILVLGISDADLEQFVSQYIGRSVTEAVQVKRRASGDEGEIDAVSGATISSLVMNDAVMVSARAVARSRGIIEGRYPVRFEGYEPADWNALVADGSFVVSELTVGEAIEAFRKSGKQLFGSGFEPPDWAAPFIRLSAGLVRPQRVGRNLLGDKSYTKEVAALTEGDELLFVAAEGIYSFKGTNWRRNGTFDRLQILQGANTIRLAADDYNRISKISLNDAPEFRETALFRLPAASGFVVTEPWRLEVLIAADQPDGSTAYHSHALTFNLPDQYRAGDGRANAQDPVTALWQKVWQDRTGEIAILAVALAVLTIILFSQDAITRRGRLYERIRLAYLVFTLVWLGWIAGAQLSVLNVLTFADALRSGFRWDFFLMDPLLFLLWGFVAVAILFWGRGVYCGWLCPFGALQELLNKIAVRLHIPQLDLPFGLQERAWTVKYVIFLGLFALSLSSLDLAQRYSEVEPFKTAIILHFMRATPYVIFAGGLLIVGLFVNRVYCRFLCPLGGALAIPARIRMFRWLRRRSRCGNPCSICATDCPVGAIYPDGEISPNECIYCLQCQRTYYDGHVCPPLIERRKRLERLQASSGAVEKAQKSREANS